MEEEKIESFVEGLDPKMRVNFALVCRVKLGDIKKIRNFIESIAEAKMIYQTTYSGKLFIKKEET